MKRKPTLQESQDHDDRILVGVATRPALFLELLCRALDSIGQIKVVGEASDEQGIGILLQDHAPELLLFDYEAFGPQSESLVSRLRHEFGATRIIVLASRSGSDSVERLLRAGASGLVGKDSTFETLVRALRAVAKGELWANRLTTAAAMERLAMGWSGHTADFLTQREKEIANHVGQGFRNKQIAERMNISEKTVKAHLASVFRKMNVASRMDVALRLNEFLGPKS